MFLREGSPQHQLLVSPECQETNVSGIYHTSTSTSSLAWQGWHFSCIYLFLLGEAASLVSADRPPEIASHHSSATTTAVCTQSCAGWKGFFSWAATYQITAWIVSYFKLRPDGWKTKRVHCKQSVGLVQLHCKAECFWKIICNFFFSSPAP